MTNNLKFQVTENKLYESYAVKSLSANNGVYNITVFYYGDYATDKDNGTIDITLTSISCKSDGIYPVLKHIGLDGTVCIDMSQGELLLYVNQIDKYKDRIDTAKASALALVDLLKEYGFPAEI